MKEKIISLKNNIITCLVNFKDIIAPAIKKNKKIMIITISTLIIIIGLIISIAGRGNKKGNIYGNINNLGFAVENKGWIYYIGYNNGQTDGIYKLKKNKKEKFTDEYARYLNKSGKYIYYLDAGNGNIVRIKTNGKDKETVIENVDLEKFIIVDNWIYYFDEAKLYKIKTNGKDKQIILEKSIENYEIEENWIYYSYKNDGKYVIAKVRTNGKDNTKVDEEAGSVFFIKGKDIYYIYENSKSENKYELCKIKTNGKKKEKICNLSNEMYIASVNFTENDLYYLKKENETN